MKYKDWLTEWLTYHVKPVTKKRTYEKYCMTARKHISPKLGEYDMLELSARVLQRFTVELSESGLSSNTVNGIVSILKLSLKRAVAFGAASAQYSDAVSRPKAREKRVECFGKDEQRKLERYIIESKREKLLGIVLCLYTGLRIGELLALTWDDIDLTGGIMRISHSCHDEWASGHYVKVIDTPKTANAYRSVPIPAPLLPRLKEHRRRAVGLFVIQGDAEYGAQVRSYQRTFELVLKRIGLPHKGFHALRHTFATRALEVGMDVKTLSEILGHGDPAVTLKRYVHSMLEHKKEMMNKVGKLLQ